jgi:hypothetical protein
MNTTTVAVPVRAGQSLGHALRVAFVALAIVALLAVSFAIGRATVGTSHSPAIAPTAPAPAVSAAPDACRFGRPC